MNKLKLVYYKMNSFVDGMEDQARVANLAQACFCYAPTIRNCYNKPGVQDH